MKVGSDDVFVDHALITGFPVVTVAVKYLPKGLICPDKGPSSMVLESHYR